MNIGKVFIFWKKNFEIDKMWFEIKNKVLILILINYSDNFYFSILINFFILSDEKWGVIVCVTRTVAQFATPLETWVPLSWKSMRF